MKAPDKIYMTQSYGEPDNVLLASFSKSHLDYHRDIEYIRADFAELTWEDIKSICRLKEDVELDVENGFVQVPEEIQFKEVLRRFNKYKAGEK